MNFKFYYASTTQSETVELIKEYVTEKCKENVTVPSNFISKVMCL